MQPCIVKQPIHNEKGELWAYELSYSNAAVDGAGQPGDVEAAATLQALLMQCNTENFLENKIAFAYFTANLLRRGTPRIFAAQSLVIEIDHDFLLLPDAMKVVNAYHDEGYRVALVGFDFNAMYLSALNTVDYVKLSFQSPSFNHKSAVEVLRELGKEVIAYHVDSAESYRRADQLSIRHMQGSYIASTLPTTLRSLNLIPGNFFRLVVAITREEPDFEEIEEIIVRDVTLTYSLLKLVNSAFFALRTRVTTVHHALVILGLEQLKQWIYLLSFNPDGKAPIEFIKASLFRASFCEALCAGMQDMPISRSDAYLMGLFSTLGSLLQVPLEQALAELSLPAEVRDALLTGEGRCGILFKLVCSYEQADWHLISEYAKLLDIPQDTLSQKYLVCMDKVSDIWKQITQVL